MVMSVIHEFECPRNLYEKLVRDNQRLEKEVNGDNLFTFVSTAVSLQPWIKQSPLSSSEIMNRLLRKIVRHPYIKLCKDITVAKSVFKLEVFDDKNAEMCIGDDKYDVNEFRSEIQDLYNNFFKQR